MAVQHPASTDLDNIPDGFGDAVWEFDLENVVPPMCDNGDDNGFVLTTTMWDPIHGCVPVEAAFATMGTSAIPTTFGDQLRDSARKPLSERIAVEQLKENRPASTDQW